MVTYINTPIINVAMDERSPLLGRKRNRAVAAAPVWVSKIDNVGAEFLFAVLVLENRTQNRRVQTALIRVVLYIQSRQPKHNGNMKGARSHHQMQKRKKKRSSKLYSKAQSEKKNVPQSPKPIAPSLPPSSSSPSRSRMQRGRVFANYTSRAQTSSFSGTAVFQSQTNPSIITNLTNLR